MCVCAHKAKSRFQPFERVDMDFKEDVRNTRDTHRNTQPNLTALAGTNKCLRKAVGTSKHRLSGECQHVFSRQKLLDKPRPESLSPESEPVINQLQIKKESNIVTKTSKKIFVWINKNPEVTLCDLARKCDTCSHNCSYVLPDVLKNKVVHCFTQDLCDGFRFRPRCIEHKKRRCEESAQVKKSVFCLSVPYKKRICQSKSLTAHQKYVKEGTDLQLLSRKTTCCFNKSRTSEDSAAFSACSSLQTQYTNKVKCQAGMWDRDAEEGPGPRSDVMGTEMCKRLKLEDGVGCSMTFDSAVKKTSITKKSKPMTDIQTDGPTKTYSSELLRLNNELDLDDPESFSCQRVRAYFGKINISCARTYMSWPFLNRCLNPKAGGSFDSTARDNSECAAVNPDQTVSSNNQVKETVQSAPTEKRNGEGILATTNWNSSCSNMVSELNIEMKNALHSFSTGGQKGRSTDSPLALSLLDNAVSNSSRSTPSPSALGLNDWEAANMSFTNCSSRNFSAVSSSCSPSLCPLKKSKGAKLKAEFLSEETQTSSCSSSFSASLYMSDSCESSLLPQSQSKSDEEVPKSQSPPKLKPWYSKSPFSHNLACCESSLLCTFSKKQCEETYSDECVLPQVLSPVTSPTSHLCRRSFSCQSSSDKEEEKNKTKSKLLPARHMDYVEHSDGEESHGRVSSSSKSSIDSTPREPSPLRDNDHVVGGNKEENQDESDCEDNVEDGNKSTAQDPLYAQIMRSLTSSVVTEPHLSPSSAEDDRGSFTNGGSNPSNIAGSGSVERNKEPADNSQSRILDEFSAYQQDILLVDVIQDDPELFNNLHKQSLVKLGPTRVTEMSKCKPPAVAKKLLSGTDGASVKLAQRLTQFTGKFYCDSPDITESKSRPWRPQMSTTTTEMQNNTCPYKDKQTQNVVLDFDVNNNDVDGGLVENCRRQPASSPNNIVPLMSLGNGSWITKSASVMSLERHTSDIYCRHYFSESLSCGFKKCRYQHLPVAGDEKFCVETVLRFIKTPMCLQKAGAVFTGYYQNNPPGMYFSMPALLSLLWALLKAGLVSEIFAVLSVSLAHNIVPDHEYLLALYNFVREKGLMGLAPELIQLTFKMVSAGLELGLDCLDGVKNAPVSQQSAHLNSPVSVSATQKVSTIAPFPEYLDLALAIVEIELCSKQENWKRLGEVFKSICKFSQHPLQVERISGRVAIALLSESKDKLSLPFAAFAETVCQNEGEDSPVIGFVGRIGVSLMLRYHRTHQWFKGRRVVEMLSISKVKYSMLKGLFGNEDGASRCYLVTVATELFLWCGSVEGALQTLRDNEWFVSSCLWPCEPADLEGRIRVLIRLTEKTSHRDTLEVLCNLPGIKETNSSIDISRYTPLFNSHLQVCVDRQILPVAAETVDFMFSKNLAVDHAALQVLLHKLGKQNLWLRARAVFRQSVSVGYYPGVLAPPGFMSLIVPCRLGEVELALTFEMLITVNAPAILHPSDSTSASLSITLKRTQTCESDYLSAGSRVLSAACILQPKIVVHYTTVNSSQEQVFTLDISSARRWLRHNHLWANEVWAH